jgi:dipeptidyl aminopeptidase/acylaminoacyl peptidase
VDAHARLEPDNNVDRDFPSSHRFHPTMRLFLLALLTATPLFAQGTKADYDRALSLSRRTEGKVLRARVEPHWLPDGDSFWYRVETAPGKFENVLVDCTKGERRPGYEPAQPAEPMAALERPRPSKAGGGETAVTFVNKTAGEAVCYWINTEGGRQKYATIKPGEKFEQHTFVGHVWAVETPGGESLGVFEAREGGGEVVIDPSRKDTKPEPRRDNREQRREQRAPETKSPYRAFLRDNNIWLRHRETNEEVQLTRDGKADDRYREPLLISPNGTRLVAVQEVPAQEHTVYYLESSPKDQVQPKLHEHNYLKPGDRIARERPRLFDLAKREAIAVDDALFKNPWDISDLRWEPDSSQFTFLYNERGHQVLRVVAVDAANGTPRTLVEDKSATFVDYSQKKWSRWLPETGELLWASELDGWNHLFRFDAKTGTLKNQITKGEWVVRGVERVDETKRQLWLRIAGIKPEQDPYYVHLARVNFDGTGFTLLTEGDGTHTWQIAPNGRWLIDTYSRVDLPPVSELRDAGSGKLVCALEKADATALNAAGWTTPEHFTAKGRDGKTDIYGVIYRPSNFDPAKKYPVVEEIYAGPHGFFVPKEWGRQTRQHGIAELGFVVVQIDGMGTNWRSRAFHDVAWRNLKDAGFPDRIAWMKAAAGTRPWMDLTRVGLYGGSAGGQNALAGLLHFGDFYKVGVADCGCHDNRMDKIWWNEAWLGEVGPWYADNSNVTHAAKLTGKLLLIVGEMDTNVDPASTMQVVNALEKANKDFDLCIVTGSNHGAAESPYGSRRRMDFLVRHLLKVEPRS